MLVRETTIPIPGESRALHKEGGQMCASAVVRLDSLLENVHRLLETKTDHP